MQDTECPLGLWRIARFRDRIEPMRFIYVASTMLGLTLAATAQNAQPARGAAAPPAMTLTIPSFPDGGQFPVKYSQAAAGVAAGEGTSPVIQWANAPAGTQSFVIHMHDLD